jgi:hypothetical protein
MPYDGVVKPTHGVVIAGALLVATSCARNAPERSESAPATPPAQAPTPPPPAPAAAEDTAKQPKSSRSKAADLSLEDATRELARAEKQLGDAVALTAPDCELARTLRDRICELADRICELTRGAADPAMTERCDDGKRRCEKAKNNVGARCD